MPKELIETRVKRSVILTAEEVLEALAYVGAVVPSNTSYSLQATMLDAHGNLTGLTLPMDGLGLTVKWEE